MSDLETQSSHTQNGDSEMRAGMLRFVADARSNDIMQQRTSISIVGTVSTVVGLCMLDVHVFVLMAVLGCTASMACWIQKHLTADRYERLLAQWGADHKRDFEDLARTVHREASHDMEWLRVVAGVRDKCRKIIESRQQASHSKTF